MFMWSFESLLMAAVAAEVAEESEGRAIPFGLDDEEEDEGIKLSSLARLLSAPPLEL